MPCDNPYLASSDAPSMAPRASASSAAELASSLGRTPQLDRPRSRHQLRENHRMSRVPRQPRGLDRLRGRGSSHRRTRAMPPQHHGRTAHHERAESASVVAVAMGCDHVRDRSGGRAPAAAMSSSSAIGRRRRCRAPSPSRVSVALGGGRAPGRELALWVAGCRPDRDRRPEAFLRTSRMLGWVGYRNVPATAARPRRWPR